MSTLHIYQVDAFTSKLFGGNPAAVMPLTEWLPDSLLQQIALENNLAETAFFVTEPEHSTADFRIRWFTPGAEVPLCGHATLASAWVLFHKLGFAMNTVRFRSLSGPLAVSRKEDDWLQLDFPNLAIEEQTTPELIRESFPSAPDTCFVVPDDTNYMVVLASEDDVQHARPNISALRDLGNQGVIITAPGHHCDFVSRYFAPGIGIGEDPATGAIHCALTPYWAARLGRDDLSARQLSARGGQLRCKLHGDRVLICGQATFYMEGQVHLPYL